MRFATIILIWISLCLQCFVQLGVVKWYEWNKAEITEKFCVNKNKPQLRCNGKCYLKKQLSKVTDEQSKDKSSSQKQVEWTVFVVPEKYSMPLSYIPRIAMLAPLYNSLYTHTPLYSVFHPPKAA